jgi:hypothetical protein
MGSCLPDCFKCLFRKLARVSQLWSQYPHSIFTALSEFEPTLSSFKTQRTQQTTLQFLVRAALKISLYFQLTSARIGCVSLIKYFLRFTSCSKHRVLDSIHNG